MTFLFSVGVIVYMVAFYRHRHAASYAVDLILMFLGGAGAAAWEREWLTLVMFLACAVMWAAVLVLRMARGGSEKIPGHPRDFR